MALNNKKKPDQQNQLPVIIVGAGPCGVVVAMILKKHGIPFVMIEKASRDKICSNAGSGFELQKTATTILHEELDIPPEVIDKIMHVYAGSYSFLLEGGTFVREMDLKVDADHEEGDGWHVATVNRADLQQLLLRHLFPTPQDEEGLLKCGVGLESYTEDTAKGVVTATLADQRSIQGRLILGCDGIHSRVRHCMHRGDDTDPLEFLNVVFYWAKCPIIEGTDLELELMKTQTISSGTSMVSGLGTPKAPGNLYLCQSRTENQRWLIWALSFPAEHAPKLSGDNTRRGGHVLKENDKQKLLAKVKGYNNGFLDKIIESTEATQITEAGLFDRKNISLPYASPGKLALLLGDAAHPQSPVLGQGANMAITDAYVIATRLAQQKAADIPTIVSHFDTSKRRSGVNAIITQARSWTKLFVTSNWFMCWVFKVMMKWTPVDAIISEGVGLDQSNRDFVADMKEELRLSLPSNASAKPSSSFPWCS